MERSSFNSAAPNRLADLNAMLFSGVCHFAVLIGLGLLAVASQDEWGGLKLMAHVGDGVESQSFDETPLDATVKLDAAVESAAAMQSVEPFDEFALPTTDFAALEALSENSSHSGGIESFDTLGGSKFGGAARRASTEFFGIGGYGQSFVYVVDCSDSMNERGKFDRARYELMQSIEQLASDQRYFVIFFNDGGYPMDAREMVLATEDQIAETAAWVAYTKAHGGTKPLPALLFALSLRPDAIYFLSDGQFDPLTVRVLRFRNRPNHRVQRQVPIHTVAFMDRAMEYLMRTIARQSGGEYRFVK